MGEGGRGERIVCFMYSQPIHNGERSAVSIATFDVPLKFGGVKTTFKTTKFQAKPDGIVYCALLFWVFFQPVSVFTHFV